MYIDKLDDIFDKYNNTYHNTISLSRHEQDNSWRDKLIVLWTLNRQAKIFLRNTYHSTTKMKNQIKIGIMINVDVSVKNIMYVKEMIFGILLQVIGKRENI